MDAISIVNLFLLLLFGTTTWLLFRDLINKIEQTVEHTLFIYQTLMIENRKPVAEPKELTNQAYSEWDES